MNHQYYLCLIVFSLFFLACNEDETPTVIEPVLVNAFQVDEQTFELTMGFVQDFGIGDSSYRDYDLFFANGGIDSDGNYTDDLTQLVYIDLNSPSLEKLDTGTYIISQEIDEDSSLVRKPATFTFAATEYNASVENGAIVSSTFYDNVIGGQVTITKEDSIFSVYTIDFELLYPNNKEVKGNYTGTLETLE